jgi:hypothetical protein
VAEPEHEPVDRERRYRYGDSGGPHFGGMTSNLLVSLTVTGDAMCRATDLTYRLDTYVAQSSYRASGSF